MRSPQARWQYLRAESEIEDLQAALSDAKVALFDERERAVGLAGENDTLKLQEVPPPASSQGDASSCIIGTSHRGRRERAGRNAAAGAQVEDRSRIQQLLALTQPVTDEVTILVREPI